MVGLSTTQLITDLPRISTDANFTVYDVEVTSVIDIEVTSIVDNLSRSTYVVDGIERNPYADQYVFNAILLAVTITMTVFGCVGNALVIGAVLTHRRLRNLGNAFVVNLAVADLAVSAFINAFGITGVVTTGSFFDNKHVLCQIIGVICIMSCSCSLWSIASIGVNRYIAIVHRNIYRDIFNKRTLPFLLITLWSICFFIDLPNLTGWGAHTFDPKLMLCTYNYAESYSYTFFFIVVGFGIPLVALIYSYARIVMYARATKAEVAAISKSDNSKSSVTNQAIRNNDLRLLRSVLTIVVVFFIMWTPYATIVVFDRYATWSRTPHVIAVVMAHMNSCINSIIYGATNKNFRQAYGRLLVTLFTCGRRRDLESKSIMSNSSASTTPSNA
ncbi:melatonin receptor type 1B-B-like [Lytechinus pictus]|uniref:melatonin receptor type 1B-B-like n=1 Tax=Lytechinus pictus TaxID=7653 RepID=UPI0030BA0856